MIRGTTKGGFDFAIPEDVFDDYELLEIIGKSGEDKSLIPIIADKMLGSEQHKRLKEHVRRDDGRVPASVMENELVDIMSAISKSTNELKN